MRPPSLGSRAVRTGLCGAGVAVALAGTAGAGGFVEHSVHVRGEHVRYAAWEPPGYDRSRVWPCVVFLHGTGENGREPLAPTRIGLGPQLALHPERWPCLVLFPQKPTDTEEWEEREDLALAVLADARRHWRIDPARVALTGMSQGGHGVWTLAAHHPGLWSALAPVCAYGRARTIAPRIGDVPVWAFHGLRDDVVLPNDTRSVVDEIRRLRAAGGSIDTTTAKLTLYAEANHNSWDSAYAEPALPQWLLAQHRKGGGR